MKNKIKYKLLMVLISVIAISCNDFLDREPLSQVTPNAYLKSEADLQTYTISHYKSGSNYVFPVHEGWNAGTFVLDNHTDNQAAVSANNRWLPGEIRVGADGGSWSFSYIRDINWFLERVVPNKNNIKGNSTNINHYIGEGYFLRAYEYFKKLKALGDFPILRKTLPDDKEALMKAVKRRPRNEVARFILSDLDSAIMLMKSGPVENKNRLSKEVAQLFRSRVALYEGTWLKYHKGTALVPGGPGWPGADKDYLKDFKIDIDSEINFFLTEAMKSAKVVADAFTLVENNGNVMGKDVFDNPYFKMFSDINMSGYSEVLFWRAYDAKLAAHHTMHYIPNGANSGYTRGFVETFLMQDGSPIYDAGSGYAGDNTLKNVVKNRDNRLQLFMMVEDDILTTTKDREIIMAKPGLFDVPEQRAVTGYNVKKGLWPDSDMTVGGNPTYTGSIVFRASEAYLNYIEASYVKNGSLDGDATKYWRQIRKRAGLPEDFTSTINKTDLSKENDWAKYSGKSLVDNTLYNIRRERRVEFLAEGFRFDDLKRWRALDMVKDYIVEGFKVWSPEISKLYVNEKGESILVALPDADPNVSSKTNSEYLRPYQIIKTNNNFYNGYNWIEAHYLSPIAFKHFLLTSDGKAENSVIYQNPGWPIESGGKPKSL